jgi:hypothetical protein
MRLYRFTRAEIESMVGGPTRSSVDKRGNLKLNGPSRDGRTIEAILAQDDPNLGDHRLRQELRMRAEYDTEADAISIVIVEGHQAERGDEVHERAIVALADTRALEVQVLYPSLGTLEPLGAAAERYELDLEALEAAARSALAAPDRVVELAVRSRTSA